MKKFGWLLCLLSLAILLSGCDPQSDYEPIDDSDAVERTDYTSVYDKIGTQVTIDMVREDENGLAYILWEGERYELGMDFLSTAMVYNTAVPEGHEKFKTPEDVYNEWWKYYIRRWNYLVPEVPLYSNEYYDLYRAKLTDFSTIHCRRPRGS